MERHDVVVVGGGPAGLTAGIYTARAGFETVVYRGGESILRRNAHLENVPGFPAGVNPRTFLDMTEAQAEAAGCSIQEGWVERVERDGAPGSAASEDTDAGTSPFVLTLAGDTAPSIRASFVVLASKNDTTPVAHFDEVGVVKRGSKTYLDTDEFGRTGLDGLYAAGRVAERLHQTVVAVGSGAETALTLVDDSDRPYYHDWVAPEGYFSGRGREIPPGCEEVDEAERRGREERSLTVMREWFAEPHPDEPTPHPSLE